MAMSSCTSIRLIINNKTEWMMDEDLWVTYVAADPFEARLEGLAVLIPPVVEKDKNVSQCAKGQLATQAAI